MDENQTTNSLLDSAIDALRVKRETISVVLPIPGDEETYFEFAFRTVSDYAMSRRLQVGAREFARGCASKPTFQARFGDDLLTDEEGAAACYLCADLMIGVSKKRRGEDGDEVLESSPAWSQREWMRFAKACPSMFMVLGQQMSEALTITAIQGEDEQLEESKKTSMMTDTFETISPSGENVTSGIRTNGTSEIGEKPETFSPLR